MQYVTVNRSIRSRGSASFRMSPQRFLDATEFAVLIPPRDVHRGIDRRRRKRITSTVSWPSRWAREFVCRTCLAVGDSQFRMAHEART